MSNNNFYRLGLERNMKDLVSKRKEVLKKFYGGQRKPGMHDFIINSGICKNCQVFIGNAKERLCPVIGLDELRLSTGN